MEKYYIISWPESQYFMKNKKCLSIEESNDECTFTLAVPCELYDNFIKNKK